MYAWNCSRAQSSTIHQPKAGKTYKGLADFFSLNKNLIKKVAPAACFPRNKRAREREADKRKGCCERLTKTVNLLR